MIIILIDGPNVSWKMIEIANERHQKQDSNACSFTCGLHVLHGAYETICYIMQLRYIFEKLFFYSQQKPC